MIIRLENRLYTRLWMIVEQIWMDNILKYVKYEIGTFPR